MLISLIALFATLLHTIFFSLSHPHPHPPTPSIPLCFDPLPYRDLVATATSESSSTVCSHPLQQSPHTARQSTSQAYISVFMWLLCLRYYLQQRVQASIGGHRSAVDCTAAIRMGNVPNTVKHCLSYEQLIQDYPWLRHWPLEEKVGVVFLVSNLLHMFCHMTLMAERLHCSQSLITTDASCCLYNGSLQMKFWPTITCYCIFKDAWDSS